MNTINSILNESLILEAIRINSGKEALELVRNNKIGVKVNPTYKAILDQNNEKYEKYKEYLEKYFQEIINNVGPNNAVFAIQLAVNKLPARRLALILDDGYFYRIISCKDKPWAKSNNDFKELITFDSKQKKYVEDDWKKVSDWIQEENQNHGKANKGSGDKEMAKTLYNDGTWSLQVPNSFQGAKAISFYGKKGEEQIPTHWCTRADKKYYDYYSSASPLYIIRNWKTGDAYQLSFIKNHVEFLDKDDKKGDDITKGDLTKIPDALLEKIKNKGKSLKDYKQEKINLDKIEKNGPLTKGNKFKDPEWSIDNARWGKEINLGNNIAKRIWENFHEGDIDKITDYMIKGKKPSAYVKHDGSYAMKYYYKDNSDFFILMFKQKEEEVSIRMSMEFFYDDNGDIEELSLEEIYSNVDDFDKLLEIAKKDSGYTVSENRRDRKHISDIESLEKSRAYIRTIKPRLDSEISDRLNRVGNKYLNGLKFEIDTAFQNIHSGGISPTYIELKADSNNETVMRMNLKKNGLSFSYDDNSPYKQHQVWVKMLSNTLGDKDAKKMDKEVIDTINNTLKEFYKKVINNKDLKNRREASRKEETGLHYESYFPY